MLAEIIKESKNTVRCISYLLFLAAVTAMFFSEYREDVKHDLRQAREGILYEDTRWGGTQNNMLVEPVPGGAYYGSVDAEVPEQVMRNMAYRLFRDVSNNQFDTYLFGVFAVHKRLNPEDRQKVLDIFEKITGKPAYEVDAEFYQMDLEKVMETRNMTVKQAKDYLKNVYYEKLEDEFAPGNTVTLLYNYEAYMPVNPNLSYTEFKKLIEEMKNIIGRKTMDYENLSDYGELMLTYDAAKARFETFVNEEKISGAYARRFCDYMGVILGIAPALIAAETVIRSIRRREKGKNRSLFHNPGADRIWIRFISITAVAFIPVLVFAAAATVELAAGVRPLGLTVGWLAFINYSVVWLLPTAMFSAAAGLFLAAATERLAGALVPLAFWLWSVRYWGENGPERILYGANLILRHNVIGEYETYISSLNGILVNRAAYALIALAVVAVLWLIERKPSRKPVRLFKF